MAVAFPISPELVLVAPPEEAAHARSLLPEPALDASVGVIRRQAPAERTFVAPGTVALVVYSGLLVAAVAFVIVAMVVHELRFVAGL